MAIRSRLFYREVNPYPFSSYRLPGPRNTLGLNGQLHTPLRPAISADQSLPYMSSSSAAAFSRASIIGVALPVDFQIA